MICWFTSFAYSKEKYAFPLQHMLVGWCGRSFSLMEVVFCKCACFFQSLTNCTQKLVPWQRLGRELLIF